MQMLQYTKVKKSQALLIVFHVCNIVIKLELNF